MSTVVQKRWKLRSSPDPVVVESLTHDRCPEPIARLLAQRGIGSPGEASVYFRPSLDQLHDPFLMQDMLVAVQRIERALGDNERIMIYGDYDVDGTTAVALMYSFLLRFTGNILFYIPDRYSEGYGISFAGIEKARQEGAALIIALDCGIKANDKVDRANELGIDMIICDHHRPGDRLPDAVAVLDPKRSDCAYPYKELSGCGIGFKLIQAIASRNGISMNELEPFLDLVAVSTACDIVPVDGENRVLAYHGLKRLNDAPRPGFQAAVGQRNIRRHHDRRRACLLRDPVISGVKPIADNLAGDQLVFGYPEIGVGNDNHRQLVAQRHHIDLVLHRTGIAVDQYTRRHFKSSQPGTRPWRRVATQIMRKSRPWDKVWPSILPSIKRPEWL